MTDSLRLLSDLWREVPGNKFIVTIGPKGVNHLAVRPDKVNAIPEAVEQLAQSGLDVYFAPSGFADRRRRADDVRGTGSFWIDLDCGPGQRYATREDALKDLGRWCRETQFPRPSTIIDSGYGAHAYWRLDGSYPRELWEPVAQRFKQALALGKVYADPARTADSASIMRLPGSLNHKVPDNPRPVRLLAHTDRTLTLEQFRDALPQVGPLRSVRTRVDDEWSVADNYPAGDAERIADACAQVGHLRDTRGAVEEPLWRAGLSILHRCKDAEHYVHEWSKGDPRYDAAETKAKAEGTGGPATCEWYQFNNPDKCAGCPHQGKVTSPIQLELAGATPPEPTPEAPETDRLHRVGAFQVTDAGIFHHPHVEDEEVEPKRITEIPIWVLDVRERARLAHEEDASTVMLEWRTVDGRVKRALIRQSVAHEARAFRAWLADYNIISAVRDTKGLSMYISQYTLAMLRDRGASEYHESLGWYDDGFVLGDRLVGPKETRKANLHSQSPIAGMQASGTVEGWKKAVQVLHKPQYWKHLFAVMAGFGSAILPLANAQSAVVSLVGQTGAGKTLAARAALSIYGPPSILMQGATATPTAVEIQLSHNRHVPYLLDEVTHLSENRLADMMYLAANGQGKAAANRAREIRRVGTWQLVPFISSNRPLREFANADFEAAHRARLLELYFDAPMPREDGAAVHYGIEDNAGAAGEMYLRAVAGMRDQIPELFRQTMDKLSARTDLPHERRFALWTMTAALVGGAIAKAIGLIDADPWDIVGRVAEDELEVAVVEVQQSSPEAVGDVVREWLVQESRRLCRWRRGGRGDTAVGEVVDDPIARFYEDGMVAVHMRALQEVLRENRIPQATFNTWAGKLKRPTNVRLAPGLPPVRSIELTEAQLGLSGEDLAP